MITELKNNFLYFSHSEDDENYFNNSLIYLCKNNAEGSFGLIINKRIQNKKPLKGEIVIIVEGYNPNLDLNIETLRANIKDKLKNNSLRDAVNLIIEETCLSKKQVYNEAVKIKNNI